MANPKDEKPEAVATGPYVPLAPDGLGDAPHLDTRKLEGDKSYLFVQQEFICGGYRHLPGMVLDPEKFRIYAPKRSEVTRRENGYLELISGEDYEEVKRRLDKAAETPATSESTVAVP